MTTLTRRWSSVSACGLRARITNCLPKIGHANLERTYIRTRIGACGHGDDYVYGRKRSYLSTISRCWIASSSISERAQTGTAQTCESQYSPKPKRILGV